MNENIIVIGSLNMDLVARSPRIPQPGETIIGGDFQTLFGGKGANQAVAAARLGARVAMVGRVGQDAFGQAILDNLTAAGVDTAFMQQDDSAATGVALIVVADDGENSIVVAPGANMNVTPADVEAAASAIAGAQVMLLQLEIPMESVIKAAELGQRHGVQVVLNPAPAQYLPPELLQRVNILIPNETEAALLTGHPAEQIEAMAGHFHHQDVETVVMTLGSRGALLSTTVGGEIVPAFPISPVDTTGAGDAFVASFGVALAGNFTLHEAIRRGNAAGAAASLHFGAQPPLSREAIEGMLARD